jgi:hypothetical protein
MTDAPPPSVGHTCTAIDRAIKWARSEGLGGSPLESALEQVRTENTALRKRLAWFEMQYQRLPDE